MKYLISIPLDSRKYDFTKAENHILYINVNKLAGYDIYQHLNFVQSEQFKVDIIEMLHDENINVLNFYVETDMDLTNVSVNAIPCWATNAENYNMTPITSLGAHIIYAEDNSYGLVSALMEKTNQTPLTITKLYEH